MHNQSRKRDGKIVCVENSNKACQRALVKSALGCGRFERLSSSPGQVWLDILLDGMYIQESIAMKRC